MNESWAPFPRSSQPNGGGGDMKRYLQQDAPSTMWKVFMYHVLWGTEQLAMLWGPKESGPKMI